MEKPMTSTNAGGSTLHASMGEPSIVKSSPIVVTPEVSTGTVPEVPVMTLALRESTVDLDPALSRRISEIVSAPIDTVRTIIEIGFGSTSAELAPAMDITEELALQMV